MTMNLRVGRLNCAYFVSKKWDTNLTPPDLSSEGYTLKGGSVASRGARAAARHKRKSTGNKSDCDGGPELEQSPVNATALDEIDSSAAEEVLTMFNHGTMQQLMALKYAW